MITHLQGDCIELLKTIPEQSVHCCVTSPPYWGLRDYGVEGQIGLEATPQEYVAKMVEVFAEVRRVLRDDATLWLNLGDSYGAVGGDTHSDFNKRWSGTGGDGSKQNQVMKGMIDRVQNTGLRPKNLIGIPWRVAFALQADGWYLRSDIIWHKPNPMPESVTDRPTKSHEYIFLLSKQQRYYYDASAIGEPLSTEPHIPGNNNGSMRATGPNDRNGHSQWEDTKERVWCKTGYRNKRSVWTVPSAAYSEAHFATFPPDLIKPCILAGCPVNGTVLDPFGGSGTTGMVAMELGRKAILIELNPAYVQLQHQRCNITPGLALS